MIDIQTAITDLLNNLKLHPENAAAALQQTEHALGTLWNQAEARGDETALDLIGNAWQQAQALAQQNVTLIQMATESGRIAVEAQRQRVEAVNLLEDEQEKNERLTGELAYVSDQLETIENEIDDLSLTGDLESLEHPKLRELAGAVEDLKLQEWEETGLHLDCPGCASSEMGWYDCLSHDAVNALCYALFTSDGEELPVELREEIASTINALGAKLAAWDQSQRDAARTILEEANNGV